MRHLLGASLMAGLLVGGGVVYLLRPGAGASNSSPVASPPPASDPVDGEVLARLDRIEQRIEELQASLAALRSNEQAASAIGKLPERSPEPPDDPTPPPAAAPAEDPLSSRPSNELLEELRDVTRGRQHEPKDVDEALNRLAILLERAQLPEERAALRTEEGILWRIKGDRAQERKAFRQALADQDITTKVGQEATYQLAWTLAYDGDPDAAIGLMDDVARQPTLSDGFRFSCRSQMIRLARETGDRDRERRELQSFIDDFGSSNGPWVEEQLRYARARLDELR